MKVALVGAGRMGSAMAGRVAAAGHEVVVFNRTRSRAEEVARRTGARVADTSREAAASAEICLVSLADDAAVTATYLADDGLIGGVQPGAVVCELSTVAPATVRGLTPLVAQKGATLIDTPVSGSVSVVESGTLTVMVGGDQAGLDRARPVLETFAKSAAAHLRGVHCTANMEPEVASLARAVAAWTDAVQSAADAHRDWQEELTLTDFGASRRAHALLSSLPAIGAVKPSVARTPLTPSA